MGRLIYLDSNVYLDYFENRRDRLRPLGEFAFGLLKRAMNCEFDILVSGHVINEVEARGCLKDFKFLLIDLGSLNKLVRVETTEADKAKARQLESEQKSHFKDALHAVLAEKGGACVLVTRNVKDFQELSDLVDIALPEAL